MHKYKPELAFPLVANEVLIFGAVGMMADVVAN